MLSSTLNESDVGSRNLKHGGAWQQARSTEGGGYKHNVNVRKNTEGGKDE